MMPSFLGLARDDETLYRRGMEMVGRIARRAGGMACAIALLSAGSALAAAGGSGTVTETQHSHNEVLFSKSVNNPCTGEGGTLTATAANEVFHATFFENGDEFWVTGTAEGTATFTPEKIGGVSASGHFAVWFGEAANNKNTVGHSTSNFNLQNTDGSHVVVHGRSHVSTNARGEVKVSYENLEPRCTP
jgi:hypothetical protein